MWEYTAMLSEDSGIVADLNALGSDGWELVSVVYAVNKGWQSFFKRPKA